jgi:hypothetical protein
MLKFGLQCNSVERKRGLQEEMRWLRGINAFLKALG